MDLPMLRIQSNRELLRWRWCAFGLATNRNLLSVWVAGLCCAMSRNGHIPLLLGVAYNPCTNADLPSQWKFLTDLNPHRVGTLGEGIDCLFR